ncbi:globin domain-containing protein [Actinocorallia sp. API 0066]|uniref:globin domain-containing protein n=1 Tax=Actinocorallia sp. API 0066 TaxID=2896846 RepID=UPI001E28A1C4|nr:globin domain-containing protein [Actinocorallia sp. API 0066]MCD0449531.1 globin domain-containing protein [Actinocorallia sp. API 0066]
MSLNPRLVKESFAILEPDAPRAAAYFYGRLFAEHPDLRALFPPAMDVQRDRLLRALATVVWSLDSPDALTTYLSELGRDHRKFGVSEAHYTAVGDALLATLRKFLGDRWTAETEASWATAYRMAAEIMHGAAVADALIAPPWWIGEVVAHERRRDDLAVVTVRPAQPLPYEAGQHVSLQVSRWPRMWRPYSIANAPRPDGRVAFHVRSVPGGWVSTALVRHTEVGHSLLLGPALGAMTLARDATRDLLCVAGGTGLAPLKALVEQVVAEGGGRGVHLVVGARTADDLYDLADLRRLAAEHPWLRVVPVVADDPSYEGLRGPVADALEGIGEWAEHEAYVSGPPEMVSATVDRLGALGLPPDRIHHDALHLEKRAGCPHLSGYITAGPKLVPPAPVRE